jgi:hypothetical protein
LVASTLVLVAVGFLPGFDNFFSGDDFDWLFNTVRTVSNPSTFLGEQSNFVRHGESLYFIINYLVAGFWFPAFFLSSLLIHLANVLLVSRLLLRMGCSELPALAGALLWGLNYRHSEAIFRPYGVADPLALVFCLAALLLYTESRQPPVRRPLTARQLLLTRRPWWAALLLLAGLFSKENALVFPAVAVLWALLIEPRTDRVTRLVQTIPMWLAAGLFYPLLKLLSSAESSYLDVDASFVTRFWEIMLSMVGPDAFYIKHVALATGEPLLPLSLAVVLIALSAAALYWMPARYRFAVLWIAVTTAPTVFVPFQMSRYYYVPLVGVAMLIGLAGTDVARLSSRRSARPAAAAAWSLYALYLAHAVWGLQLEEDDYQFMGDIHRRAAASFRSQVAGALPEPGGALTLFVRGDTMFWTDALQRQCDSRPWYWPATYKWVYRRPYGVLGLTNTHGFVTFCLDDRRRRPLFVAAAEDDYRRAMAADEFVVVAHDNGTNSFRWLSAEERREIAVVAADSDLYRYLQPGRIDPTAMGGRQLGH